MKKAGIRIGRVLISSINTSYKQYGDKKERFKMGASASAGRESNSPTSTSTEGRVGIPLRCPVCDTLFDTEEQITDHRRQIHIQ